MGVRDSVIRSMMLKLKKYENIFKFSREQLQHYFRMEPRELDAVFSASKFSMEKYIRQLQEKEIGVITLLSNKYPESLRHIASPPAFLFYRGNLRVLQGKTIGIVGTRKATVYGKNSCEKIVDGLVRAGVTTVSGLALGIDTYCHKRTMEKNGKTVAVLGSGIDITYPQENRKYWETIPENGLILSEYPPGTTPAPYNFPQRNRIIAGISKGVVVIESRVKGGSLITAKLALDEGRDVFALPGDIFSPVSEGCNVLIKNSEAKLITSAEDILVEYGWRGEKEESLELQLSPVERQIFYHLRGEMNLDELILVTGINAGNLLATLMGLELKGVVSSVPGGRYRRKV